MNLSSKNTKNEESAYNQTEQISSQFPFDIHEAIVYPGSIRIPTSAENFSLTQQSFVHF